MKQYDLLHKAITKSTDNIGNGDIPILWLVEMLENKEVIPPYFQRDYVWEQESGTSKVKEWIYSILSKNAIGVIVTYQLPEISTIWLADGLQRLTATKRFIENPSRYGFSDITPKEAKEVCKHFLITRQHRIYDTHNEARKAFQNLNKGTSLTPQEFFKGELTRTEIGSEVHEKLPLIINSLTDSITTREQISRGREHILIRDSFSLFLQYITDVKSSGFWYVSSNKVDISKSIVEKDLSIWIDTKNRDEIEKAIKNFESFIASKVNHIKEVRRDTNQEGKTFSSALLRWLLHFSIWVKNNSVPVTEFEAFLVEVMKTQLRNRNLSSRITISISDSEDLNYTIGLNSLGPFNRISEHLGCNIHNYPIKRVKGYGDKGKDLSHKIPISKKGNNSETFYESASRNRSRGAQVVMNLDSKITPAQPTPTDTKSESRQ